MNSLSTLQSRFRAQLIYSYHCQGESGCLFFCIFAFSAPSYVPQQWLPNGLAHLQPTELSASRHTTLVAIAVAFRVFGQVPSYQSDSRTEYFSLCSEPSVGQPGKRSFSIDVFRHAGLDVCLMDGLLHQCVPKHSHSPGVGGMCLVFGTQR